MTIQTRLGLAVLVVGLAAVPTSGFPVDGAVESGTPPSVPVVDGGQDPVLGQEAKLVAPDPKPKSYLGMSLAIDGDTLVAGAPWEERPSGWDGSVYVFERDSNGWDQVQKIVPPNAINESGSAFGTSLALDGDTLLVAYDSKKVNDTYGAGVVYIFEHNGDEWVFVKKLTGDSRHDYFGVRVALSDDQAFIGAFNHSDNNNPETHVVHRVKGTWERAQLLDKGTTGGPGLALEGSTAVIAQQGMNRVHIYMHLSDGWTHSATLHDPTPNGDDRFGWAADVDGHKVIVGEIWGDQAHVFREGDDGWILEATLPKPAGASDSFGWPVEIQGDFAFVGARGEAVLGWQAPVSEGLGNGAGAIYVYRHREANGGGGWTYEGRLTALDAGRGDLFGTAMDFDGDSLAVGAMQDNHGDASRLGFLGVGDTVEEGNQGSAYVFSPDADGDRLANRAEDWIGTEKKDPDTDRDGMDDGTEVSCGWGPDDPSSPTSAGPLVATSNAPPVPVGEHRWWLCGLAGE